MKKTIFCLFFVLAAVLFLQSSPLEARHHHRSSHVQVGVGMGANIGIRDAYVARRYVRPVAQQVYVAAPGAYYTPVYVYPTQAYVEEVYVAPPARQVGLGIGGLSFSWNFFR